MIYDDLSEHLSQSVSIEQAALPMGIYLAWCVNMGLVSQRLHDDAGALLLRVRYREVTGTVLAVSACGGRLSAEHLTDAGQAFTATHYADYLQALEAEFGSLYEFPDNWASYDRIAPMLTRRLLAPGRRSETQGKKWQFWKRRPKS